VFFTGPIEWQASPDGAGQLRPTIRERLDQCDQIQHVFFQDVAMSARRQRPRATRRRRNL
jgi:hypothetical protein